MCRKFGVKEQEKRGNMSHAQGWEIVKRGDD